MTDTVLNSQVNRQIRQDWGYVSVRLRSSLKLGLNSDVERHGKCVASNVRLADQTGVCCQRMLSKRQLFIGL